MAVQIDVGKDVDPKWLEETLLEIGAQLSGELAHETKPEVRILRLDTNTVRYALLLRIINPAKSNLLASKVRRQVLEKLKADKSK